MTRDPLWLSVAKGLPAGKSRRVQCCAKDRSMIVTNGTKGYHGHCFRCGLHPFEAHGLFTVQQLARRKAELALIEERTVKLPSDFTLDIPTSEAIWLFKAGINSAIARHYKFGYSPSLRRVILPVYKNGELIGFTARSTCNERPKYIEKMLSPSEGIFLADPALILPSYKDWSETAGPDCVITEDILSSVRVGRVVRRSVSLLGTSGSAEQLSQGVQGSRSIAVWLDGDKAGRTAAQRIVRSLTLQGYEVRDIRTPKDPKLYSNKEIREWLCHVST